VLATWGNGSNGGLTASGGQPTTIRPHIPEQTPFWTDPWIVQ
jgi:hypothetical protein